MKNYTVIILLVSLFTFFSALADNNVSLVHKNNNLLLIDPGHNQKRGKDKSVLELYYGLESSVALKYNLPPGQTSYTERLYLMIGSGFDSDMFLKIGILGNPTKRNQNMSSFPNPKSRIASFFKAYRYVMLRKGWEFGFKGHFLDTDEISVDYIKNIGYVNDNYSGLTINRTWILDGNFLFDKTSWRLFDHRTARRIRIKFDIGAFFNLNKFNKPDIDFVSLPSNDVVDFQINEDESNNFGQVEDPLAANYNPNFGNSLRMATYPTLSIYANFSIGFAF